MKLLTLLPIFLFLSQIGYSQFTVVEANLNYQFINYNGENGYLNENKTKTNTFNAGLTGIYRFHRIFGGGINLNFPLAQQSKWSFYDAPLSTGGRLESYGGEFSSSPGFQPFLYNYHLKHSPALSIIGRFFFKPDCPFQIDLRYTFFTVEESFQFARLGQFPRNTQYMEKRNAKGPGLSLIATKVYDNKFYYKYQYSLDFLSFDETEGFSYNIEVRDQFVPISANLTSAIKSNHLSHNWIVGFGYYF